MSRTAPSATEPDAAHRAFRAFSRTSPYGLLLVDRDLVIRWASPTMTVLTGSPPADLVGRVVNDEVHPDDFGVVSAILGEAPAATHELRFRHADGRWVTFEAAGSAQFDDPDVQGGLLSLRDVSEQDELDDILRLLAEDAPLDAVLTAVVTLMEHRLHPARAAVVYEDGRGIVRHAGDPAFAGVLRSHWRRRPGQRSMASIPVAESVGFAEIWEIPFGATDEEPAVGALYVLSPAANALRSAPTSLLRRCAHVSGLAVRRWHARAALVQVASRDPLTGLHNRGALGELVERLRTQPTTTPDRPVTGILYCDLDGFDVVNDAFGHNGGDRVLRVAAERIVREARTADMCARVGDDQFVIVCSRLRDNRFAQALAHRLVRRFAQPINVEEGEAVIVPMRIGVATTAFPAQIPELVAAADRALHRAKEKGEATELDVVGPPRRTVDR